MERPPPCSPGREQSGIETLVWLTGIAGLPRHQAVEVMRCSARTLLHTAMADAGAEQR